MRAYTRLFKYRVYATEPSTVYELIVWIGATVSLYVLTFVGAPILEALSHGATLDGSYLIISGKYQGASIHTIRSGLMYTVPLFVATLFGVISSLAYRRGWLDRYKENE